MKKSSVMLIAALIACGLAEAKTTSPIHRNTAMISKSGGAVTDTIPTNTKKRKSKPSLPQNAPATYPNNPTTNPNPNPATNPVNPANPTTNPSPMTPPVNPASPTTSPTNPPSTSPVPSPVPSTTPVPNTTMPHK